jgi:hypothetical protein
VSHYDPQIRDIKKLVDQGKDLMELEEEEVEEEVPEEEDEEVRLRHLIVAMVVGEVGTK